MLNRSSFFIIVSLMNILAILSCSYSVRIQCDPSDATLFINEIVKPLDLRVECDEATVDILIRREGYEEYQEQAHLLRRLFATKITAVMQRKRYPVTIDLADGTADLLLNGEAIGQTPYDATFDHGIYQLTMISSDLTVDVTMDVNRAGDYLFRPQQLLAPISQMGIYDCGPLAKQVNFTPDDRFLFLALLADRGFQVFDMQSREMLYFVKPGPHPELSGYVEGLFIEEYGLYYISQMNTAMIFKYDYTTLYQEQPPALLAEIPTQGLWSKVLAYSKALDLVAVSNWSSNDITIFDRSSDVLVARVANIKVPRGMAFSSDGKWLYAAAFEGAMIHKIRTSDWLEEAVISLSGSAMRHIVINSDDSHIYVSDMAWNKVYDVDTESFSIVDTWKVYNNTNTIDLGPDDRYLYVCNRGPNSQDGYLQRSPKNGRIYIIDVTTGKTVCEIEGGNQPTGLDVSNNGKVLAFSNFRDKNFELYDVSALLLDTTLDSVE